MIPQVIYLNGPSSSGKTTLARALQNSLPTPYLYLSIDQIIELMPSSINDFTGKTETQGYYFKDKKLVVGPYAQKINPLFHQVVLTILKNGHHLIIDDIAFGKTQVDLWRQTLKDYSVLWVGLTASLDTLESREKLRSDRLPGSARAQLAQVHQNVTYDILIDTSKESLEDCLNKFIF